jgi:hypothetical protein
MSLYWSMTLTIMSYFVRHVASTWTHSEREVRAKASKRIVYLSLRRRGVSQATAIARIGNISRASAFRWDKEAGLSSNHGKRTFRSPAPDPRLRTDNRAIDHDSTLLGSRRNVAQDGV